jgi:hypothetical protein
VPAARPGDVLGRDGRQKIIRFFADLSTGGGPPGLKKAPGGRKKQIWRGGRKSDENEVFFEKFCVFGVLAFVKHWMSPLKPGMIIA